MRSATFSEYNDKNQAQQKKNMYSASLGAEPPLMKKKTVRLSDEYADAIDDFNKMKYLRGREDYRISEQDKESSDFNH